MIPSVEVSPGHIAVLAPLDGIVLSVAVAAGDQVAPGDELLVIESMKMEHPVQAEAAGLVQSVLVAVGVTVAAGTVLVALAPSGEFGGMGLEGAVRLGYRNELDAIADPQARQARYEELVAEHYTRGKALSTAAAFEIDDVIDPADTRAVLADVLDRA